MVKIGRITLDNGEIVDDCLIVGSPANSHAYYMRSNGNEGQVPWVHVDYRFSYVVQDFKVKERNDTKLKIKFSVI